MRSALYCLAFIGLALLAQAYPNPSLTSIEDVVLRADGSRFNGTAYIQWRAFNSADASTVGTSQITVPIRDGVLSVKLIPTINSVGGAFYTVRYQSEGRFQFSEVWTVPASSTTLKLRDIKVPLAAGASSGLGSGGPIQLGDVVGLLDELALRAQKGAGYVPSRAVFIDAQGNLVAVSGTAGDCVRVDGTSGPCGTGGSGGGPVFIDLEVPAGAIDGSNRVFTLGAAPSPSTSLHLYRNGILQRPGVDFAIIGAVVTFLPDSTPQSGDLIQGSYRR